MIEKSQEMIRLQEEIRGIEIKKVNLQVRIDRVSNLPLVHETVKEERENIVSSLFKERGGLDAQIRDLGIQLERETVRFLASEEPEWEEMPRV